MPTIQDSFGTTIQRGFPGQIANGEASNRFSRTIEDSEGIAFGAPAFEGAGDHGIVFTPSDDFVGWAIADHGLPIYPGGTADLYPEGATVPVCSQGVIFVTNGSGGAVAKGEQVYAVAVTGVVTNDANGGANFLIAGWRFDEAAADGAVVRITNLREVI